MNLLPSSHFFTAVKRPEYFFWSAALLAFILFIQAGGEPSPSSDESLTAGVATARVEKKADPFSLISLEAKSAAVYDVRNDIFLYDRMGDIPRPLASITKIMTAVTALSLVPDGTLITITPEALKQEGDTGLRADEAWPIKDLLRFMLLESSNDAAYAISSTVGSIGASVENPEFGRGFFIARMNQQAKEMDLTSTYFLNESGLDISDTAPGSVSTAREVSYLLARSFTRYPFIFQSTRLGELTFHNENGDERIATNTNKDTEKVPLLIASKTGYTDLAGGNLVIAFEAGFDYPIIVSVLGSTMDGRFTDAEKLVWATLEFLEQR